MLLQVTTQLLCPYYDFCNKHTHPVLNLVYTRADGPNDTMHYLYSTGGILTPQYRGIPTVLVTQTEPQGKLLVNWDNFFNNTPKSITFSKDVHYSYAVLIKTVGYFLTAHF